MKRRERWTFRSIFTGTDVEFDRLVVERVREMTTAYHPDGTDYIDDELEQRVLEAIGRYAFLPKNSLAGIAAIQAVRTWIAEKAEEQR